MPSFFHASADLADAFYQFKCDALAEDFAFNFPERADVFGVRSILEDGREVAVSDDEILSANETYGSLGELAIMSLPKQQILNLFKKLELGDVTKEMSTSEDFLATIKDANVKEIIAKESLEYHPTKSR